MTVDGKKNYQRGQQQPQPPAALVGVSARSNGKKSNSSSWCCIGKTRTTTGTIPDVNNRPQQQQPRGSQQQQQPQRTTTSSTNSRYNSMNNLSGKIPRKASGSSNKRAPPPPPPPPGQLQQQQPPRVSSFGEAVAAAGGAISRGNRRPLKKRRVGAAGAAKNHHPAPPFRGVGGAHSGSGGRKRLQSSSAAAATANSAGTTCKPPGRSGAANGDQQQRRRRRPREEDRPPPPPPRAPAGKAASVAADDDDDDDDVAPPSHSLPPPSGPAAAAAAKAGSPPRSWSSANHPKSWFVKVGTRVKIWWELERQYYKGTVTKISHRSGRKQPYKVVFDDGDILWYDLDVEEWDEVPPEEETDDDGGDVDNSGGGDDDEEEEWDGNDDAATFEEEEEELACDDEDDELCEDECDKKTKNKPRPPPKAKAAKQQQKSTKNAVASKDEAAAKKKSPPPQQQKQVERAEAAEKPRNKKKKKKQQLQLKRSRDDEVEAQETLAAGGGNEGADVPRKKKKKKNKKAPAAAAVAAKTSEPSPASSRGIPELPEEYRKLFGQKRYDRRNDYACVRICDPAAVPEQQGDVVRLWLDAYDDKKKLGGTTAAPMVLPYIASRKEKTHNENVYLLIDESCLGTEKEALQHLLCRRKQQRKEKEAKEDQKLRVPDDEKLRLDALQTATAAATAALPKRDELFDPPHEEEEVKEQQQPLTKRSSSPVEPPTPPSTKQDELVDPNQQQQQQQQQERSPSPVRPSSPPTSMPKRTLPESLQGDQKQVVVEEKGALDRLLDCKIELDSINKIKAELESGSSKERCKDLLEQLKSAELDLDIIHASKIASTLRQLKVDPSAKKSLVKPILSKWKAIYLEELKTLVDTWSESLDGSNVKLVEECVTEISNRFAGHCLARMVKRFEMLKLMVRSDALFASEGVKTENFENIYQPIYATLSPVIDQWRAALESADVDGIQRFAAEFYALFNGGRLPNYVVKHYRMVDLLVRSEEVLATNGIVHRLREEVLSSTLKPIVAAWRAALNGGNARDVERHVVEFAEQFQGHSCLPRDVLDNFPVFDLIISTGAVFNGNAITSQEFQRLSVLMNSSLH